MSWGVLRRGLPSLLGSPERFFSNPDITKTVFLVEASSPAQALPRQFHGRAVWHSVRDTVLLPGEALAPSGHV